MARIFVTGSTQGVGRNAAETLISQGHEVILHARNAERAESFGDLSEKAKILIGDLASLADVRRLAAELNAVGQMDAIIHNAGIIDDERTQTEDGLLRVLMVNTIAPYMLSVLTDHPRRLIFTGSSMHRGHPEVLNDLDWTKRPWSAGSAYGETKLLVTALSAGLAHQFPQILCHTVDPGWVPTRMGGRSASDPLDQAHLTQCWLATSDDAAVKENGGYWHHMKRQAADPVTASHDFQSQVIARLAALSGTPLPKL